MNANKRAGGGRGVSTETPYSSQLHVHAALYGTSIFVLLFERLRREVVPTTPGS